MFYCANKFNQDLNSWKINNVISMPYMFVNAIRFEKFNCNWGIFYRSDVF